MSTNPPGGLPNFSEFELPGGEDFDLVDINAEDTLTTLEDQDVPLELGKDLMFSFDTGNFDPTGSNWVRVCGEAQALFQWIHVALTTPKGASVLYPEGFGSDIPHILGMGLRASELAAELPEAIRESLLQHDRIAEIRDFQLYSDQEGLLQVAFRVILDDDAVLSFRAALPFLT